MVEYLIELFSGIPKELALILISAFPVVELRGGIIAAKLMGVPFSLGFPICIFGNMLLIPFVLLFLNKIFAFLRRFPIFERFLNFLDRKAEKNKGKVEKWKTFGLMIFVAIPLPGTGAWTGALVANALNMPVKKSLPAIFAGVVIAGIIMSIISYFIPGLFGF